MSEQSSQTAVVKVACVPLTAGPSVPGNGAGQLHIVPANGKARDNGNGKAPLAEKMNQATGLLAELAEHIGAIAPEHKHVFDDARTAINEVEMLLTHAPEGAGGNVTRIVAPMPGVVLRCEKKPGDHVKKGDIVVILDAMKVENPIQIPVNGKVINIRHREGERVAKGSVLAIIKH